MNADEKSRKGLVEAKRTVPIWLGLFVVLVLVVGVILYNGIIGVPSSAMFLQNYSPDSSKTWDTFKNEHHELDPTLLYIQLEEALFQGSVDYISRVAKTENEACKCIEDGFDFVCDFQGHKLFRKRK